MTSLLTWWNCLKVQRANHMDNERHRWSQAAKDLFEEREEAKIMFGDIVRGQIGWFGKVARVEIVELSLDAIWQKHINTDTLAFMWMLDIGYSGSACGSLELQYYTLPFTTKRGARLQRNYTQFTNHERRKMKKVNQSVVENIWRRSSIDFNLIRYFMALARICHSARAVTWESTFLVRQCLPPFHSTWQDTSSTLYFFHAESCP